MEATVFYLLMLQKYIISKQKTLKYKIIMCWGNISTDFTINNMIKKPGLKGSVKCFTVDFNPIYTNDILDIHKYLIK